MGNCDADRRGLLTAFAGFEKPAQKKSPQSLVILPPRAPWLAVVAFSLRDSCLTLALLLQACKLIAGLEKEEKFNQANFSFAESELVVSKQIYTDTVSLLSARIADELKG